MLNLLRRLIGSSSPSIPASPEHVPPMPSLPARVVQPTRVDAVLEVVGESHRQGALMTLSGGRTEDGPVNPDHVAVLMSDPANPFDPNAVAVIAGGHHVGYLSRADAELWTPILHWATARGMHLAAEARLIGGWDRGPSDRGSLGIVLHLGTPSETFVELLLGETSVRMDHPWPSRLVAFTGDSRFRLDGVPIDRAATEVIAQRAGMHVHPRVTKKVQLLVDCDESGISGNQAKAEEYGIPVIDEETFWAALGLPVERVAWNDRQRQPPAWARGR